MYTEDEYPEIPDLLEKCVKVYESVGYSYRQNFQDEYVFLYNPDTGEKVRLYHSGRVIEG